MKENSITLPGRLILILPEGNSFPGGASGKEPACQCRRHERLGFDPWVGRIPLEGKHSNPLQYSCLKNPMDSGAWWAAVRGVTESPESEHFQFTSLFRSSSESRKRSILHHHHSHFHQNSFYRLGCRERFRGGWDGGSVALKAIWRLLSGLERWDLVFLS